jgi:hypothetical protein
LNTNDFRGILEGGLCTTLFSMTKTQDMNKN